MAADPITAQTVDALLNDEEFDSDDPFGDKPTKPVPRDDKPTLSPRKRKADDLFGTLDEEVKIVKARKKIPKLDAERLLSEPGLPKIRTLVRSGKLKEKLRLRGKGHEFNDVAKLLNYYQMWLDQLYPRAKFADATQMVEKAGHTKRLQIYRKSWIDEGRPGYVSKEAANEAVQGEQPSGSAHASHEKSSDSIRSFEEEDPDSMFFGSNEDDQVFDNGPNDDELEALMAQESEIQTRQQPTANADLESEGEDDLDALLREQETVRQKRTEALDEQDELDAMLQAELASSTRASKQPPSVVNKITANSSAKTISQQQLNSQVLSTQTQIITEGQQHAAENDADELGLLLEENEAVEPELPPNPTISKFPPSTSNAISYHTDSEEVPELDAGISSSPIPNVQTDELDELMDEHDALVKQKQAEAGIVGNAATSSM